MSDYRPTEASYFLLALLPPAAGLAFLRSLWLSGDVDGGWVWLWAGLAAGVGAGAALAPYLRTRPGIARRSPQTVAAVALAAFGVPTLGDVRFAPVYALPATAFITGLALVACVVCVLWVAGKYRIEVRHRATVCVGTAGDDDFYQAYCECGWRSRRLPMTRDDTSEEQAFAAARRHTPKVRRGVVAGYYPPLK
ncbi:hypothetical protein ABZS66_26055 [Dactylosporangium sp. NPDC005572]|uniref:hypothetical protein n=1 Tax=Dactylosporangium sp. NPDC005572 TaxID=3156889 RepID=UPI0033B98E29